MGFLCLLLGAVECVWCVLMPVVGSLHLISAKYKEENKNKPALLQHWCYYWIAYFTLKVLCGFLSFLPGGITGILCAARIIALSAMASPKLNFTTAIFEQIQSRTSTLGSIRNTVIELVLGKTDGDKKDK